MKTLNAYKYISVDSPLEATFLPDSVGKGRHYISDIDQSYLPLTETMTNAGVKAIACGSASPIRTFGRMNTYSIEPRPLMRRMLPTAQMVFIEQFSSQYIAHHTGNMWLGNGIGSVIGAALDLNTRYSLNTLRTKSFLFLRHNFYCATVRNMGAIYATSQNDHPIQNGALYALTRCIDSFGLQAITSDGTLMINHTVIRNVMKNAIKNVPLSILYMGAQQTISKWLQKSVKAQHSTHEPTHPH